MSKIRSQLRTQNFMTFQSYFVLPDRHLIKTQMDRLGIQLGSKQGQYTQHYFKFSNRIILNIFLLLLSGRALHTCIGSYKSIDRLIQLNCMSHQGQYLFKQLQTSDIVQLHSLLKDWIINNKIEVSQFNEAEVIGIVSMLQQSQNIVIARAYKHNILPKEQTVNLVIYKLSNYYIMGVYQVNQREEPIQEQYSFKRNWLQILFIIVIFVVLTLLLIDLGDTLKSNYRDRY